VSSARSVSSTVRYRHILSFHGTWFSDVQRGHCGVVGNTLAFGSIGHGFESEHRLFSHHGASAFSRTGAVGSISLSPLYPSLTIDLHVRIAADLYTFQN